MENLTGNWKKHCDYRFFSSDDLVNDVTLTIKSSKFEEVFDSVIKRKVQKPVLYFEKTKLGFVLGNQINPKQIALNLGTPNMEEWIGKQITLTRIPDKRFTFVTRVKPVINSKIKI